MNLNYSVTLEPLYLDGLGNADIAIVVSFAAKKNATIRFEYDHDKPVMFISWNSTISLYQDVEGGNAFVASSKPFDL